MALSNRGAKSGKCLKLSKSQKVKFKDLIRTKSQLDPTSGCWNWVWKGGVKQYPIVRRVELGKSWIKAHRLSFAAFSGSVPAGLVVRHTCDNRKCVNPRHLTLGSQADNNRDTVDRGRRRGGRMVKLNPGDMRSLRFLRGLGYTQGRLANLFSVSQSVVSNYLKAMKSTEDRLPTRYDKAGGTEFH